MTTFQLVTVPLLSLLAIITAVATARSRVTPRIGLGWVRFIGMTRSGWASGADARSLVASRPQCAGIRARRR